MIPSVGRIVHYQSFGTPGGEYLPEPRAAVITTVKGIIAAGGGWGGNVGLAILNPTGLFFNDSVPFSETPKPGHWNWPPRDTKTLSDGGVLRTFDTPSGPVCSVTMPRVAGGDVHAINGLVGHAGPPLGIPAVFPNGEVHQ